MVELSSGAVVGYTGVDYFLWAATLDGMLVTPGPVHLAAPPYTYPGVVACQIRGAGLTGGDWDQSLVFESKIWVSLPPVPVPVPVPRVSRAQAETAVAGVSPQSTPLGSHLTTHRERGESVRVRTGRDRPSPVPP